MRLVRSNRAPLSTMARLGKQLFFDTRFSSSGRLSCASCHSPRHAYGPPAGGAVMNGGPQLSRQGLRAVPSLEYLERQPPFRIGPDSDEAGMQSAGTHLVPQGGLFWDGRADTLQDQARSPLLSRFEMDGGSVDRIAALLRRNYAPRFVQLFGRSLLAHPKLLVGEALFAIGRYQIEDPSFHPYSSKYDAWLEGKARFSPSELRGYRIFNDPKRGNCAACHLDRPSADGLPPLFTDHQYEALGVPRNRALTSNRNPRSYDLGLCGPMRDDLRSQAQYCGMFATPTLRNVATRHVFFHNGRYRSLREVLDFYNMRAVAPQKIYPDGLPDDLPAAYQGNLDRTAPFDRKIGERPPLSARDEDDVIAFLKTLTDGYAPNARSAGRDRGRSPANRGRAMELFVEAAWVDEHLADPAVAIVDARSMPLTVYHASFGREQYLMGHIPGAIHLDYATELQDIETTYAARVAPPERFAGAMQTAGIGDGTMVIAYDGGDFPYAARLVWMLHYYGHDEAAVLNGGIEAWTAAGLPRETEVPWRDVAEFTPHVRAELRASREEVLDAVEGRRNAQLLSVLGDAAYAVRDSDIPGARRLSCSLLFDELTGGKVVTRKRLREVAAGLDPGRRTITFCSNGVSAAGAYVALRTADFTDVAVYDGSLADWTHHSLPTVATR